MQLSGARTITWNIRSIQKTEVEELEKEILKKWEEIYLYASRIVAYNPWSRFGEKDLFAFLTKDKKEEHLFCFLEESCGDCAIAFYRNGSDCFNAQRRLHGVNPKKEPVFLLQNAIIFRLGNREDVSKANYALLKELNIKCRGRGSWPYFEQYRIGYAPQPVCEGDLDRLLDDLGNLWMMLRAVFEEGMPTNFENRQVVTRCYSPMDDMFYTYMAPLKHIPRTTYTTITMTENKWLSLMRGLPSKGTIALDWSYLPTVVYEGRERIVPRLLLAVDARTGCIIKSEMLPPSDAPYDDLFEILESIIAVRGKPAAIEICDQELECYLTDFCKQAKIRLEVRKQLKQTTAARRELLKSMMNAF